MDGNEMGDEVRWAAVVGRDARQDGRFVYGVVTTGVFCKPSCASRRPLRRNVRFFTDAAAAEGAGLRACLRCRPGAADVEDAGVAAVRAACRWMEGHAEEKVGYPELAARAGMSAAHFHRTFKRVMGVTPKGFQDHLRMGKFKSALRRGTAVTASVYESGYGSGSRVYERVDGALGMTPGAYRRGGEAIAMSYASAETPLGRMMLAGTDRGLCFLQFGESEEGLLGMLRAEFPRASIAAMREPALPEFAAWMGSVREYLEGAGEGLALPVEALPVDLRATAFQVRVWRHLQGIPAGETRSYADVAAAMGVPRAVRAVAGACARNRVALVVPCHRVLRSDGGLGGFRWGLERKRRLLEMERR